MYKHKKTYDNQISIEVWTTSIVDTDKKIVRDRNIKFISIKDLSNLVAMNNKLVDLSSNDYLKDKTKIDTYMCNLFRQIITQSNENIKELKQI